MRIFLLRHGESLGNVQPENYKTTSDHQIPLTDIGKQQARAAGRFVRDFFTEEGLGKKIGIYYSPFVRTQETKDEFLSTLGRDLVAKLREDYALVEQDFGLFNNHPTKEEREKAYPEEFKRFRLSIEQKGKFYAKTPNGESRMDVTMRTRVFLGTLMRDFDKGYYDDVIIIGHGVTNRAIEMNFMHMDVDWFEKEPNPGHCDIKLIEKLSTGKYETSYIYRGGEPVSLSVKSKNAMKS